MISMATCLWASAGFFAGGVHSFGIGQAAAQAGIWVAASGMLRLALVACVLTAAAIGGYLFPAVAGWVVGFALTMILLTWRMA